LFDEKKPDTKDLVTLFLSGIAYLLRKNLIPTNLPAFVIYSVTRPIPAISLNICFIYTFIYIFRHNIYPIYSSSSPLAALSVFVPLFVVEKRDRARPRYVV
jgi:hypothetical protein